MFQKAKSTSAYDYLILDLSSNQRWCIVIQLKDDVMAALLIRDLAGEAALLLALEALGVDFVDRRGMLSLERSRDATPILDSLLQCLIHFMKSRNLVGFIQQIVAQVSIKSSMMMLTLKGIAYKSINSVDISVFLDFSYC